MGKVVPKPSAPAAGPAISPPRADKGPALIAMPSLHERVVDLLRGMIVDGEIAAGTRLSEQDLCEQLGISRTPLREAIKVLAFEGLLTLLANRGAVVTTPDMPEVVDTIEVIGMLEASAAMLCAARASDAYLQAIAAVHTDLIEYSRANALADYFRANTTLHDMIVAGADNAVMRDLHVRLGSQLKRVRSARLDESSPGERDAFIAEHQKIVDALLRRDGMAAFQAMTAHMTSVAKGRS